MMDRTLFVKLKTKARTVTREKNKNNNDATMHAAFILLRCYQRKCLIAGPFEDLETKGCLWDLCSQRELPTEETVILASPEKSPLYWGWFDTYCDSFEREMMVFSCDASSSLFALLG